MCHKDGVSIHEHVVNDGFLESTISPFATKYRCAYKVKENQHLFMAVAWVTNHELLRFRKAPEVIHVDGTSKTNKEKFILFTVTVKDRFGKMCIVMRAFLPNEKNWAFHWLFSKAFPLLFPKRLLDRIRVVISDGDSSECNQIDIAIRTILRNAIRVRCAWHIVNRGWKKYCSNSMYTCFDGAQRQQYKKVINMIQGWIYSWMKPHYCENKEEYVISKILLDGFILSVTDYIGSFNVTKIRSFIAHHVIVHEDHYVFYKRKSIRHFDEKDNCCHEGTNNGSKSCAGKVTPNIHVDKSCIRLCNQAQRNTELHNQILGREFIGHKHWSTLRCADKLISRGVGLLEHQWDRRKCYVSVKIDRNKWFVLRNTPVEPSIIPLFLRTYVVTTRSGVLYCSCKHFERHGIPCRHQLCVLSTMPKYVEPSHHDVAISWWCDYQYEGLSSEGGEEELSECFVYLEKHDVRGPQFDESLLEEAPISKVVDTLYLKCRDQPICSNYNLDGMNYTARSTHLFGTNRTIKHVSKNIQNFQNNLLLDSTYDSQAERESVWDKLYPHFKDLVSTVEDDDNAQNTITQLIDYMDNMALQLRGKQASKFLPDDSVQYVSINHGSERSRVTHGTQ